MVMASFPVSCNKEVEGNWSFVGWMTCAVFRWFVPVVCDYNISVDKVGKSKHNKTLLRYKESKDRQHVSALLL
jgi:hypothetical protein